MSGCCLIAMTWEWLRKVIFQDVSSFSSRERFHCKRFIIIILLWAFSAARGVVSALNQHHTIFGTWYPINIFSLFQLRPRMAREAARAEGIPFWADHDGEERTKVTSCSPCWQLQTRNHHQACFQTAAAWSWQQWGQCSVTRPHNTSQGGPQLGGAQPQHGLALARAHLPQLCHLSWHLLHQDITCPCSCPVSSGLQTSFLQQCRALCRLRGQSFR